MALNRIHTIGAFGMGGVALFFYLHIKIVVLASNIYSSYNYILYSKKKRNLVYRKSGP